jgi:hypothetical protein
VDGITEAMAAHGLNPIDNADVARFAGILPRPLADAGAVVVLIDHVSKSREARGRYAIGAQHKLAAVTGAAYTVELIKPFGHGLHGVAKITIAKDRPGRVREHSRKVAGVLHLDSQPDGSVMAQITLPARQLQAADDDAAPFRPTVLMHRISEVIERQPGLSGRAVIAATQGKTDHKKLALELLIAEGYVAADRAGNARRHTSLGPFRTEDDPT